MGFPPVSVIWRQLLASQLKGPVPTFLKRDVDSDENYRTKPFPSVDPSNSASQARKRRAGPASYASPIDSFSSIGPFFTRLVTLKLLSRPLVVTTLQRDTVSLSGNAGTLSLGALPYDLKDDHLTWVPIRSYRASEGGLPPSPEAPNEVTLHALALVFIFNSSRRFIHWPGRYLWTTCTLMRILRITFNWSYSYNNIAKLDSH